jgi:predicted regulator of Ras-like GTPase activity (Roadblock/LC7/MglB family)
MGGVLQAVIELEDGYLVVTEAGTGACLALLASSHADLGMVAYEMNVLVQQVGPALSAGPRVLPAEPPAFRVP